MSDTAQGPGFELPSYDELMNQYGGNIGQDKLEKISQILATAQMTHAVLSNFTPYMEAVKKISNTVFDPIKNELVAAGGKAQSVMGKIPGGSGNISAEDMLTFAKNPRAAKTLLKTKLAQGEQFVKEKFTEAKTQGSKALKQFTDGEVPDLPGTEILSKEKLIGAAKDFAKRADISDRIVADFEDVVNQRYDAIPAAMKQNLLDMGISENDLRQVVSGSAPRDLMAVAKERLGRGSKFADPFESPELDIPSEYLDKLYKANKYIDKLKLPVEQGGAGMGDSTLARLGKTAKKAYTDVKTQAEDTVTEFESTPLKIGKRLKVKLDAQARKRTADLQEQMNNEPEFPQPKPTAGKPLVNEFEEVPEINMSMQSSQATTQAVANGESEFTSADDSVNSTISNLQKAKSKLTDLTEDTGELEDLPFGDLINAGLGIATVATMIAGLFDNQPKPTLTVSGDQLGV